ncbi:MAG: fumarylacetoacetate hydrolase family protein [Hyphomicrobiaceae bacterium]
MKLATVRNGTRDGELVLVSGDLSKAVRAADAIAGLLTMQQLLDDWDSYVLPAERIASELDEVSEGASSRLRVVDFDPARAMAPLPRAYQWADGSAYLNHVELARKARGAMMPESFATDPLMYQGGSDTLLGAHDPIELVDEAWGLDLEGEIAVILGDVPMGVSRAAALDYVRLVVLVNDVSLRNLIPGEIAKGFGFFHGKPSSAFSPVAVTPDELGPAWRDGKVHLPLLAFVNSEALGQPDAGRDMAFSFADLIAHAAKTRRLSAGTILGSGTVSNRGEGGDPGLPVGQGGVGYTCLAEVRMLETLLHGKPRTPFLKAGDRVRIDMLDAAGQSVFGAIDQRIVPHKA